MEYKSESTGKSSYYFERFKQGALTGLTWVSKGLGALVGLIYFPLTMPFIRAAADVQILQAKNREYWHRYKPSKSDPHPLYYVSASMVVAANTVFRFFLIPFKFIGIFFYSLWQGLSQGFKKGLFGALTAPAYSFNRYHTNGNSVKNKLHFRSTHLLVLGLVITVAFCAIATTLIFFFPWLFAPLAVLTKLTGFNLAALLGVKATGLMLPLLNFTSLLILTLPLVYGLKAAVFSLVSLGKAAGEFFLGIHNPRSQGYQGSRLAFVMNRLTLLADKIIAVAVGIPLYLAFKPYYQILDLTRLFNRSNRRIWRAGMAQSEKKETFLGEWFYKLGVLLTILANSVARIAIAPFQLLGSILYAPLQAVRHAVKYGTTYVLGYPYHFANSYRGELCEDGSDKEYIPNGRNYDKIHVKKYENIYYFKFRHLAIVALLVGLAMVLLSALIPPLGFITINLGIKALTPLGFASFNLSGTAVLIINFLTGVVGTALAAVAVKAASWSLWKLSQGITLVKNFLSRSDHFHNLLHTVVTAGDAMRLMVKEKLAVKTIASRVDDKAASNKKDKDDATKFGTSWKYNLRQLKNPSGVGDPEGRPVYLENDPQRKYDQRNKTYESYNPRTGVYETKKMGGPRGRPKWWRYILSLITFNLIPAYTKKSCVSLAPKDGMMTFFGGRDKPIGLAFDISKLDTKGDKRVFRTDAWTNKCWTWGWKLNDPECKPYVQASISMDGIRSDLRIQRKAGIIPKHTDINACLTATAAASIVISTHSDEDRVNGIYRKLMIKYKLGYDLPILITGTLSNVFGFNEAAQPCNAYTIEWQLVDLFNLWRGVYSTDRCQKNYKALKANYAEGTTDEARERYLVRALVNSHAVNWATVFKKLPNGQNDNFREYIRDATGTDLYAEVDAKPMPTHFTFATG